MKKYFIALFLTTAFFWSCSIMAITGNAASAGTPLIQPASATDGFSVGIEIPGHGKTFTGYDDWISAFYSFSIRLGSILTVLMLIFAGYKYMTSQGNPTAINEAKDILIGSLSGYALLLLVALVLNFINVPTS